MTHEFAPGSIDSEFYVPKVDQFAIVADGSTSMADHWDRERKLTVVRAFLASMNQTVPELGYEGTMRSFGRGACRTTGKTVVMYGPDEYSTTGFGQPIEKLRCPAGCSPLDKALNAVGGDLSKTDIPTAVVIVSDGLHMGNKEVAAAGALAGAFGDDLAIYVVQVGDDSRGGRLLEKVVAKGNGGYLVPAAELMTAAQMEKFVRDVFLYPDSDADGVPDHLDKCPDTPKGVEVDAVGCPLDTDGDGVPDYLDKCPGTPRGVKVDEVGCPIDSDGDGVPDYLDKCPGTPSGVKVDANGCPLDSDGDGVPDDLDKCPGTPKGVPVDGTGCPLEGITVMGDEWMVRGNILFALNKANLKPEAKELLGMAADFLKKNPQFVMEVQGHTDSTGPMAWNMELSQMRADSVKAFLVGKGVAEDRLKTKGYGPHEPVSPDDTAENRAKNRRVDFKPLAP
jgi:OOP family OmpA-OmpF porin